MTINTGRIAPLALAVALTPALFSSNSWAEGSIWDRDKLSGDWGGMRTKLSDRGVDFNLRLSQFYQNVTSGGVNSDSSGKYGVKFDTWINVDGHKLFNSWQGLNISAHIETRYGKDVLDDAGTFTLPNAPLLFPAPGDYSGTQVTNFMVSQVLFDGKAAMVAGKVGAFDLLQGMFPDIVDYGLDGFMNANSIMSILSWGRWLTLSQYGAGAWTIEDGMPSTGFIVTGATNTTTTWSFDNAFSDGVGILAFHRFLFKIDDKKGYIYIGGGGSTKEYPSLDPHNLVGTSNGIKDSKQKKPLSIAAYWYQEIWKAPHNDKRRAQVFAGASLSDDNPSFARWDAFASVQAYGLFAQRPADRMGLAGHYYRYGDDYVSLANDVPGQEFRDNSWTLEAFYNLEVTKWMHLTPSLQYVQNEQASDDPAVIPGLRFVLDF